MYCRRCGKQIDYVAEICLECQRELLDATAAPEEKKETAREKPETPTAAAPAAQSEVKAPDEKRGRAVASTVMGAVSAVVNLFCAAVSVSAASSGAGSQSQLALHWMGAIAMAILAIVFGIKSIIHYKKCRTEYGVKLKATLALGIVGVALSYCGLNLMLQMVFSMWF